MTDKHEMNENIEIIDEYGECSVCGHGFTEIEWQDRHTDPRDGMSDCHNRCCPRCNPKKRSKKAKAK